MKNAEFAIDLNLERAYEDKEGNLFVVGVASDTRVDKVRDRMSKMAINKMARQVRDNSIPLLPSHRDSFEIGESVDGVVREADGASELLVTFKLDPAFPQAVKLFKEVSGRNCQRQLSIGGRVPYLTNPNAVKFDTLPTGESVRTVQDIELDHVATTRKGQAAVPSTGFIDAICKAVDDVDEKEWSVIEKSVVSFKHFPLADRASSWSFSASDGNALIDRGGMDLFKDVHTIFDPQSLENKGAYKLPHHKVSEGTIKTYFRGVVAAGASLLGARRPVQIAASDRAGAADHLRRHYAEFEAEAPAGLKSIDDGKEPEAWNEKEFVEWHEKQGIEMSWFKEAMDGTVQEPQSAPAVQKSEGESSDAGLVAQLLRGLTSLLKGKGANPDKEDELKTLKDVRAALTAVLEKEETQKDTQSLEDLLSMRDMIAQFLGKHKPEDEAKAKAEAEAKAKAEAEKAAAHKDEILKHVSEDLKSQLAGLGESIQKTVQEGLASQIQEVSKSTVESLKKLQAEQAEARKADEQKLADAVTAIQERLEKVEKTTGGSQALPGQDGGKKTETEGGLFRGVFSSAVRQATARMKDSKEEGK